MNIGEVAKASGVNAKLIRHYESIGIIPKASRSQSGYREYTEADINILCFVKRARTLGFSMKDIKKLLGLWRNRTRKSSDVKVLTLTHIKQLEDKIQALQSIRNTLVDLALHCHGDDRPTCPILDDFTKKK